jgi:hypothetical protein
MVVISLISDTYSNLDLRPKSCKLHAASTQLPPYRFIAIIIFRLFWLSVEKMLHEVIHYTKRDSRGNDCGFYI